METSARHLLMGKELLSFDNAKTLTYVRTDIFIITELNSPLRYCGHRLDTDLVTQQELELTPFLRILDESYSSNLCSITCNGYYSDTLVLGDDAGRLHLIDTRNRHEAKRISYQRDDMITDISMNPKFILAGTENGFLGLWDCKGDQKFEFQAEGFIHNVSIHGNRILAETNSNVYIWELNTARR